MDNSINGHTKVLGLIGDPIEHSLSPGIHNTICRHLNLNYTYVPFRVSPDNLKEAVKGFKALGVTGFNVTIPHKKDIIKYLDEVSKEALLMGAVNTVKNIEGKLYGYNTDGEGLIKSFKSEHISIKDKKVVVIGAGGASRGICIKMAMEGVRHITILNRTRDKADNICNVINSNIQDIARSAEWDDNTLRQYGEQCDVLIHTTPIGMYPETHRCPVKDFDFIHSNMVVCDLIYNPFKTVLLQKAEEKGCKVVNGWGMLLFQAISAFEIWTGVKIHRDLINRLQKVNRS